MERRGGSSFSAAETWNANSGAKLILDKDGKAVVNHVAERAKEPLIYFSSDLERTSMIYSYLTVIRTTFYLINKLGDS